MPHTILPNAPFGGFSKGGGFTRYTIRIWFSSTSTTAQVVLAQSILCFREDVWKKLRAFHGSQKKEDHFRTIFILRLTDNFISARLSFALSNTNTLPCFVSLAGRPDRFRQNDVDRFQKEEAGDNLLTLPFSGC